MADLMQTYLKEADRYFANSWVFVELEKRTKVPKTFIGAGFYFALFFISYFNLGAALIVNLFGFVYAATASTARMRNSTHTDYIQWQTFWYIYGLMTIVEYFNDFLLYWLPNYYLYKLVFFMWLMYPSTRGATTTYFFFNPPIRIEVKYD